jgi:hypothetical protein
MRDENVDSEKRRAILKGAAATLGITAAGVASAHPGSGDHGFAGHEHDADVVENDMTTVGYHSLGRRGSESFAGQPERPHYGGISELRVKGDIAAVGILSSHEPTLDRGIAMLDVSGYTRANSRTEIERAEMNVLGFIPNENQGTSVMDLKFSDDGEYLFATRQPVAAAYELADTEKRPGVDETSSNAEHGGIFAYDVSNAADPERLGRQVYGFGLHNCYHHRIRGEDFVFGVTGPVGDPAGIYVHQFDRNSGELQFINYWTHDTELTQGEIEEPVEETYAHGNEYYAHDITVIDDPVTGDPYAYLANWGIGHDDEGESQSGARILDVSDPRDIEELGLFRMERAHTIEALRRTVNGKRLFVVGQENPDPDPDTGGDEGRDDISNESGHSGHYYLVDATGVENGEPLGEASYDGDEARTGDELAKWLWRENVEYDNYTYSAHNIDIIDTEVDGTRRLFVTAGHYHAGTRVLEIGYPGGPVPEDDVTADETDPAVDDGTQDTRTIDEGGIGSGSGGWTMAEVGWSRTHENVDEEAKFGALSGATPYHWCAVEENGVIFSSCISTGVYAMRLDDPAIPVGTRTVLDPKVDLRDDGHAFTGGQTNHVTIEVSTKETAEVRIRIPKLWDVVAGDPHEVHETVDYTIVEFTGPVDGEECRNVFIEAPEATTGTYYTIGPVELTPDVGADRDQQVWQSVPDTEDQNLVVGVSQN